MSSQKVTDIEDYISEKFLYGLPIEKRGCNADVKNFLGGGVHGKAYDLHNSDLVVKIAKVTQLQMKYFFSKCISQQRGWFSKELPPPGYSGSVFYPTGVEDYHCEQQTRVGNRVVTNEPVFFEYMMGVIASNPVHRAKKQRKTYYDSVNFLKYDSVSLCDKNWLTLQKPGDKEKTKMRDAAQTTHLYMEKITGSLYNLMKKGAIDLIDIDGIIIQVMFAFACMQHPGVMMVHNDLHIQNVFLLENKDRDILDSDFGEYTVNHRKYTIPTQYLRYIFKMGDFDWGAKYSHPMLINEKTHNVACIPNYYNTAYDIVYFISSLAKTRINGGYSRVLGYTLDWIFQGRPHFTVGKMGPYYRDDMNMDVRKIKYDFPHVSAEEFFKQPFVTALLSNRVFKGDTVYNLGTVNYDNFKVIRSKSMSYDPVYVSDVSLSTLSNSLTPETSLSSSIENFIVNSSSSPSGGGGGGGGGENKVSVTIEYIDHSSESKKTQSQSRSSRASSKLTISKTPSPPVIQSPSKKASSHPNINATPVLKPSVRKTPTPKALTIKSASLHTSAPKKSSEKINPTPVMKKATPKELSQKINPTPVMKKSPSRKIASAQTSTTKNIEWDRMSRQQKIEQCRQVPNVIVVDKINIAFSK